MGRSKVAVVLAVLAAAAAAGCGGSGPELVDSSTTTPLPTPASAAAAPATTGGPVTTGTIASTTSAVPLTTGESGPAGERLTFRRLTLRLRDGWRAGGGGDHVAVATGRACRRSAGGVDCPGFLLLGPTQIAIANRLARYDPDAFWHPGAALEGCPQDRDGLTEVAPTHPLKAGTAEVGGKEAVYREWKVACVDAATSKPKGSYLQRVWHLPRSGILIVDEWSTPGLPAVLAAARFG
jgi:hypothetical protein